MVFRDTIISAISVTFKYPAHATFDCQTKFVSMWRRIRITLELVFSSIPALIVYGIFALSMATMRFFAISCKAAKKELKNIIFRQYDNAWEIVHMRRHFTTGNMNPNIFHVCFEDRKNPDIRFSCYWNAREKVTDQQSTEKYTLGDYYQKAIDKYLTQEQIKANMGDGFAPITFLGNRISLTLNFEPELAVLKAAGEQMSKELEAQDQKQAVYLYFKTPRHPMGLYYIYIHPSTAQNSFHAEFIHGSIHVNRHSPLINCQLSQICNTRFEQWISEQTQNQGKLKSNSPVIWLNQENMDKIHALFYIEQVHTKEHQLANTLGYLQVWFSITTMQLNLHRRVIEPVESHRAIIEKVEKSLPEQYHTHIWNRSKL